MKNSSMDAVCEAISILEWLERDSPLYEDEVQKAIDLLFKVLREES